MKTSDFDYQLPENSIAQHPLRDRSACRMAVLPRRGGETQHRLFTDLPSLLKPGDCLVFNDTKVLPCRIPCRKQGTGAAVEVFLLHPDRLAVPLEALCRPKKRLSPETRLEPLKNPTAGFFVVKELQPGSSGQVLLEWKGKTPLDAKALNTLGITPLPPYIQRDEIPDKPQSLEDETYYQTVFATQDGSCAAPTASLHFDLAILRALGDAGIDVAQLTLHVGAGTFFPVKTEDPAQHPMHLERFYIGAETIEKIEKTRATGGRVVAVGTTVLRALETAWKDGIPQAGWDETKLYVLPGFTFKIVDGLLTNFHQPRSTLLMLVAALAGRERLLNLYNNCIKKGYRFLSYGDCMFIT